MPPLREALISAALLRRLTDGCRARLPEEACGLLLGRLQEGRAAAEVLELAFVPNAAAEPTQTFALEPQALVAAACAAQKSRRQIVGFFHSHPGSPPHPSRADLAGWDGFGCYLIVGLAQAQPELGVYARSPDGGLARIPLAVR